MKYLFVFISIIFCSTQLFALDNNLQWWQKANHFYQGKQYDSAVFYYEKIADSKPANVEVYYNLGNAYYRLNNIGMAVLNYRRALKINPSYKEASDNLLLAESRISNRIQPSPELFFVQWWKSITRGSYATGWSIFSVILFFVFLALLVIRTIKNPYWLKPQLLAGSVAIWLLILFIAFKSSQHAVTHDIAVVMENDAPLVSAPQQAKAQSYIPEGTTVKLLHENAGYTEIQLPDGRSGWMQNNYLNKI